MIACALSLAFAPAVTVQSAGFDMRSVLVQAADHDRSGSVEAAEWQAYCVSLEADADGRLDSDRVKAGLLVYDWDWDRDGTLTSSDLRRAFEDLDGDRNGVLVAPEIGAVPGGFSQFMALTVLFHAADSGDDWQVETGEWSVLEAAGGEEGRIALASVRRWMDQVEAEPPPEDPNAITPGIYLLTITSLLDNDFDGSVTLDDLRQIHADLDLDGDGNLDASELRPRRRRDTDSTAPPAPPSASSLDEVVEEDEVGLPAPVIPWQRSLEDALALVELTKKPLLLCVNVDGESASEVMARGRYRDPAFAELTRGFIPLLLSPNVHSPREYDDRGRRIPDPKFGRVVQSEHIEHDDAITERYFDGQRVATRHKALDADGNTLFDIYLVNDLSVIDRALAEHGVFGAELPDPDRLDEQQLLASPDAACRDRLEDLFLRGDERTRVRLASLCLSSARPTQHPEVLRMALLDRSDRVRRQAVWAVVQHAERVETDLLLPAFRAAGEDASQLAALVSAVRRVAYSSGDDARKGRAERLERVFTGLQERSTALDVDRWRLALTFAPRTEELPPTADQKEAVVARIADLEARLEGASDDRELNLLFADTLMRLARIQMLEGQNPTYLFEDVRAAAALATSDDLPDGRALGYLAWSSYMLSDSESAVDYASRALPHLRGQAGSPLAAQVLQVFAQGRIRGLYDGMAGGEWPDSWIADIRDTYEALLVHPSVSEKQVIDYLKFLDVVEAHRLQEDVVRRAIALFPASTEVHRSFRNQMLRDHGAGFLEEAYETLETPPEESASFAWYAGLATLVAAERHVQNKETEAALGAYGLSVDRFRASIAEEPEFEGSASHYISLALAGTANLHLERERWDAALDAIRTGITENPRSATFTDGLGNTPAAIAGRVHRALLRSGRAAEASSLREVLDGHGVKMGG